MRARIIGLAAVVMAIVMGFGFVPEAHAGAPSGDFEQVSRSRSGSSSARSPRTKRVRKKRKTTKRRTTKRSRRRSTRTTWMRFQFTLGAGAYTQSGSSPAPEEGALSTISVFAGMPLGNYSPGLYTSFGGRLQSEICGSDCDKMSFGPAFRLGLADGARRRLAPDRMIYAEAALMLAEPSSQTDADASDFFPRLAVGISSPGWRNRMFKNYTRSRSSGAGIFWLFLAPFNHLEAFIEPLGGPEQSELRAGFMIGMGL